jgi:hypothetical protein
MLGNPTDGTPGDVRANCTRSLPHAGEPFDLLGAVLDAPPWRAAPRAATRLPALSSRWKTIIALSLVKRRVKAR